jgi:hypothetical protein
MTNKALLKETLKYIEDHPEQWDQWALRCETGCCFAGWASLLAGGRWEKPEDHDDDMLKAQGDWPREDAWDRGKRVLELNMIYAERLFDIDNSFDDLREIVDELCEED